MSAYLEPPSPLRFVSPTIRNPLSRAKGEEASRNVPHLFLNSTASHPEAPSTSITTQPHLTLHSEPSWPAEIPNRKLFGDENHDSKGGMTGDVTVKALGRYKSWLDEDLIKEEGEVEDKRKGKESYKKKTAMELLQKLERMQDVLKKTKVELKEVEARLVRKQETSMASAGKKETPTKLKEEAKEEREIIIQRKLREIALLKAEMKIQQVKLSKLGEKTQGAEKNHTEKFLQEGTALLAEMEVQEEKVIRLRDMMKRARERVDEAERRGTTRFGQTTMTVEAAVIARQESRIPRITHHTCDLRTADSGQDIRVSQNQVEKRKIRLIPADSISNGDKKASMTKSSILVPKNQATTTNPASASPDLKLEIVDGVETKVSTTGRASRRVQPTLLSTPLQPVYTSIYHDAHSGAPGENTVDLVLAWMSTRKSHLLKTIDGKEYRVSVGGMAPHPACEAQGKSETSPAMQNKSDGKHVYPDQQKNRDSSKVYNEAKTALLKEKTLVEASIYHNALEDQAGYFKSSVNDGRSKKTLLPTWKFSSFLPDQVQSVRTSSSKNPYAADFPEFGVTEQRLGSASCLVSSEPVGSANKLFETSSQNNSNLLDPAKAPRFSLRVNNEPQPESKLVRLAVSPDVLSTLHESGTPINLPIADKSKEDKQTSDTSTVSDTSSVAVVTSSSITVARPTDESAMTKEKDWVLLSNGDEEDVDDEWDLCIEGEKMKLKDAKESWDVVSKRILGESH